MNFACTHHNKQESTPMFISLLKFTNHPFQALPFERVLIYMYIILKEIRFLCCPTFFSLELNITKKKRNNHIVLDEIGYHPCVREITNRE